MLEEDLLIELSACLSFLHHDNCLPEMLAWCRRNTMLHENKMWKPISLWVPEMQDHLKFGLNYILSPMESPSIAGCTVSLLPIENKYAWVAAMDMYYLSSTGH